MSDVQHSINIFLDGNIYSRMMRSHLPRQGDTVRLKEDKYAKVTEVIWCFDENVSSRDDMRVNLRLETIIDP